MATIDNDNPSGIEFDDPGPGAGTSVPANLAAPKKPVDIAALNASKKANKPAATPAKTTAKPAAPKATPKAAAVPTKPADPKGRTWFFEAVERYKIQTQLNAIEAKGGNIEFVVPSTATQNTYDVLYYINN